jgi:hypothetical protein
MRTGAVTDFDSRLAGEKVSPSSPELAVADVEESTTTPMFGERQGSSAAAGAASASVKPDARKT